MYTKVTSTKNLKILPKSTKNFFRMSPVYKNTSRVYTCLFKLLARPRTQNQTRLLCLATKNTKMTDWSTEKTRILTMPLKEKRALYKCDSYTQLLDVETWPDYAIKNKVDVKKHTPADLEEFKKITINPEMNDNIAKRVSIFRGDITNLEIDAVVNAANSLLKAGGGVDGAIHRAAGPLLQLECNTLGGCKTGEAKVTCGYNMPAKYVIHTVGPQNGSEKDLQSCYEKCLAYQNEYEIRSFAFPCISTGIYGFPNRLACHVALRTVRKFLETNPHVDRVIFCLFMPVDVAIYETLMQMYFPIHDGNYSIDGAVNYSIVE